LHCDLEGDRGLFRVDRRQRQDDGRVLDLDRADITKTMCSKAEDAHTGGVYRLARGARRAADAVVVYMRRGPVVISSWSVERGSQPHGSGEVLFGHVPFTVGASGVRSIDRAVFAEVDGDVVGISAPVGPVEEVSSLGVLVGDSGSLVDLVVGHSRQAH